MRNSQKTTIEIDIDVYRAIEARRTSFQQSHNEILRDVFGAPHITQESPVLSAPNPRTRRTGAFAFQLHGKRVEAGSLKDTYLRCLQALAELEPQFLENLSSVSTKSRRIVARQPEHLYLKTPKLASKFAMALPGGWWADTNLSRQQCESRLKSACDVARIRFGRDLILELPD